MDINQISSEDYAVFFAWGERSWESSSSQHWREQKKQNWKARKKCLWNIGLLWRSYHPWPLLLLSLPRTKNRMFLAGNTLKVLKHNIVILNLERVYAGQPEDLKQQTFLHIPPSWRPHRPYLLAKLNLLVANTIPGRRSLPVMIHWPW